VLFSVTRNIGRRFGAHRSRLVALSNLARHPARESLSVGDGKPRAFKHSVIMILRRS
jgi:hypothetical protein